MITEELEDNFIKNNKIYNQKKLIKYLLQILKKHRMVDGVFKPTIYILINKDYSPSDIFLVEYVFKVIGNINYKIIYEESLIIEKNTIIVWNDWINIVNKSIFFNINHIDSVSKIGNKEEYVLMGISSEMSKIIEKLEDHFSIRILEYENSESILFSRIKRA